MNPYYTDSSIVYSNGHFVHPEESKIDAYSQSIHYGNGVFEGIRSYKTAHGARIFKAVEHYERLLNGAKLMGLSVDYTVDELIDITYKLLDKNGLEDAYIRPLLMTGANMSLQSSTTSRLYIQCWKWGKYMGEKLLKVMTSSFERPNPKSCFVEAKVTGHYINSILATNEAKSLGYDESLMLDMHGDVAECSGANIFVEKDNALFTPKRGHIMPGITRTTIIELCAREGIKIEERQFKLDELKNADSAFFTGTAAEVIGLASIDDYTFPKAWESTLGHQLMHLYQREVLGLAGEKNKLAS